MKITTESYLAYSIAVSGMHIYMYVSINLFLGGVAGMEGGREGEIISGFRIILIIVGKSL